MTRDVAPKIGFEKSSLIESKFFLALQVFCLGFGLNAGAICPLLLVFFWLYYKMVMISGALLHVGRLFYFLFTGGEH
jgi:hypothetical protein